jgi:PAS domain-containing protein
VTEDSTALPSDQLLDALEVAVFVFDRHGRILFANRRARRELDVFGEPFERQGMPFASGLVFLDQSGEVLEDEELPPVRALRDGTALNDFVMGVRSDSHPDAKWFTATTQPLLGERGDIVGVIVTAVDVTG